MILGEYLDSIQTVIFDWSELVFKFNAVVTNMLRSRDHWIWLGNSLGSEVRDCLCSCWAWGGLKIVKLQSGKTCSVKLEMATFPWGQWWPHQNILIYPEPLLCLARIWWITKFPLNHVWNAQKLHSKLTFFSTFQFFPWFLFLLLLFLSL